ncbi:hypothetical protein ACFQGW_20470 [Xanthomonas theicola]|uniref:hypothetical protein n=1 Tax=Xanthomonas theicola TaxID=56464 RepID=UPI0036111E95
MRVGMQRLARERQRLMAVQEQCSRLQAEISMQQQLAGSRALGGVALDRQQLFGWLRKSAADRRRSQALRLELRRQQELGQECLERVGAQRVLCLRLEARRERYRKLLGGERRTARLRQLEIEECELEERASWSK